MKGPVVLLGPPGAGKSTLAPRAASMLGMAHADLDAELGDAAALFQDVGEAAFRMRELSALNRVLDGRDVLVAAGSGVVDTESARRMLSERALCIVVDVDVGDALVRLTTAHASKRPWLPRDLGEARVAVAERIARRRAWWDSLAVAHVDGRGSPDAVASALANAVDALRPIVPSPCDVPFVASLAEALQVACDADHVLIVADAAVAERVAAVRPVAVVLEGGERTKTLGAVEDLAQRLVHAGARRDTRIVAVGGGSVLDAVGLCAAVLFRGVSWAAVPTTLLAQVDAGIGGKTAVNLAGMKNVVGAFHPPARTVVSAAWRTTLDAHAIHAGRVEALKHEFLAADAPLDGSARPCLDIVRRSLEVKTAVVRRDPSERGLRAVLNLGHTLGHALEATFGISHGHAVQHGLRAMLRLSVAHAGLAPAVAEALDERLRAVGPLCALPNLDDRIDELLGALRVDKKADARGIRWVLLRAPGLPVLARIPDDVVREVALTLAP